MKPSILLSSLFLLALAGVPAAVTAAEISDAMARQKALEGLALNLSQAPKVRQSRAEQRKIFLARPNARTPDGKTSLDDAATQHFYGAVDLVTNMDPHHPEILMAFLYEHEIDGQRFPSALHGGLENPDNAYRLIPISYDSRYELHGVRHDPAPAQVTYELMDTIPGVPVSSEDASALIERNMKAGHDRSVNQQLAMLMDRDMKVASDGSFTITIDSDPANGRPNHIQSTPETRALFIRDSLSNWATQRPDRLSIVRTAGPETPAWTEQALVDKAAALVPAYAQFWVELRDRMVGKLKYKTNVFDPPLARSGGWGFIGNAHFDIKDDEALVFTADPKPSPYFSAMLGNHWWVAMEAARRSGSLNTSQVRPNRNGTITYVVAARDPGAWNWLDTGGLHQGIIQLRWQGTPVSMTSLDGVITGARVVKLKQIRKQLPAETVWITPAERRAQLAARLASYRNRLD